MRLVRWVLFSLLVSASLWGQSAPAPNSAPLPNAAPAPGSAPASQPNPAASPSRFPGQPMSPVEANSMYLDQVKRMRDQLKAMQSKLDQIKANATKVKDPVLKQQLQLDNELWAMMLSQLQAVSALTAQSRSYARLESAEHGYRQRRPAPRPLPVSPVLATPATSAAPAASESEPVVPSDHP